ncbi:TonB-dependent siderophore receptor [Methylosinus sp. LW4]|uniref:TonB-dependent siderophore receptor n=1 Tax=Methylosinus sp. LW4 TaxID=136993 RepID=UPI000381918D|nr:TonB-dependent receptor [Methylosinus sp. LW4]
MSRKMRWLFVGGAPASAMTAVGLILAGSTFALDASPARAYATPQTYDIPGGPMTDALNRLADMSGAQLAYDAALTRSIKSRGVSGKRTLPEALDELLAGTGLGYKFDPTGEYVAIMLAQADNGVRSDAGAEPLPPIDIGAERPRADGPGNGKPVLTPQNSYVVRNASTATKTDTPVMNTPINVQTITEKALQDQQAITLGEALRNVSGVTVPGGGAASSSERGGYIFVRGFATTDIYRDGFRVAPGGAQLFDAVSSRQLVNVQSVEVLKGPAAILYGRSEPGGIINLTTKDPEDTPHYSIGQQIGSLALYRTTASATGPLTQDKSILYRLDASYENNGAPFGSFVDDTHSTNFFIAPVVKWNLDEATSLKAEFEYADDKSSFHSWLTPRFNGSYITIPRNVNYATPDSEHMPTVLGSLTLAHKFDEDWSIKERVVYNHSYTSNGVSAAPFTAVPGTNGAQLITASVGGGSGEMSTISTNLDVVGHFDTLTVRHTLLLGGDYYRTSSTANGYFFLPGGFTTINSAFPLFPGVPTTSIFVSNPLLPFPIPVSLSTLFPPTSTIGFNRQDTAGLYVQDQLELPYGFHILAGARYQKIYQTSSSAVSTGVLASYPYPLRQSGSPLEEAKVTPRFGLLWRPQQWVSLYGNYTEGFAPNTGNVFPGTLAPPSSAVSWEAGAKFEFFDGALRAAADYYSLVKTNIPVTDTDVTHRCNGANCVLLSGEARSQGPELDIQGTLLPGWNIIVNYTNQDVRVTKGASRGNGQSGLQPGQRFPNVPRNLASLWSTYEFQDGVLQGLKLGAGYTYHGSQPVYDQTGGIPGIIPLTASWGTVDLMAAYRFVVDGVKTTAQINVTNLFDRTYYTDATAAPATAGISVGSFRAYGAPFAVSGQLRVEF